MKRHSAILTVYFRKNVQKVRFLPSFFKKLALVHSLIMVKSKKLKLKPAKRSLYK